MKYLKRFLEAVNNDTLIDIRDILIDFSDKGNEVRVDWVDSKYKHGIVVVIKNKTEDLDSETFIRLLTYLKELGFQCRYIFCEDYGSSDKIYIAQSARDFGLEKNIEAINSWRALELVFHKMK